MNNEKNKLFMERKRTTQVIIGVILTLILFIMLIETKSHRLGWILTTSFGYLFGSFIIFVLFFLLVFALICFIPREKKLSKTFKGILICLAAIGFFLSIAVSNSLVDPDNGVYLSGIFGRYNNIFIANNINNPFVGGSDYTNIYKIIVSQPAPYNGGIIGNICFAFLAQITTFKVAIVISYIGAGVFFIIMLLLIVSKFKKLGKKTEAFMEERKRAREEKRIQQSEELEKEETSVTPFNFDGDVTEEDQSVISRYEIESTTSSESIDNSPFVGFEVQAPQFVNSKMDAFDVFKDDILAGKPVNPLIDDIDGGVEFDVFSSSIIDDDGSEFIASPFIEEVRDLSGQHLFTEQKPQTDFVAEHVSVSTIVSEESITEQETIEPVGEYVEPLVEEELFEEPTELEEISETEEYEEGFEPIVEETYIEEEQVEEVIEEPITSEVISTPIEESVEVKKEPEPIIEEEVEKPKPPRVVKGYKLPPMSLLDNPKSFDISKNEEMAQIKAIRLENKLKSLNIRGKVKDYIIAPAFTRFRIEVESDVKISVFNNVQRDIQMALEANQIDILLPIPGSEYVGVDIPNEERSVVTFKECLQGIPFDKKDEPLLTVSGKDILGKVISFKINSTPHLLVAGATGGGKSAGMNAMIMSLLMRTRPDQVGIIMIDPKKVEFAPYAGIPHLICPVITDAKQGCTALQRAAEEIDIRNSKIQAVGKRNIEGYNQVMLAKNGELMPYIVIFVDELANLMVASEGAVEKPISVITSLARSVGIHLIVATQRPSVDVVTGVIKSNIPSRIAYTTFSAMDSRVILDDVGAEKLLGKGDMLLKLAGQYNYSRVQGCWVDDNEIERVTNFLREQQEASYDDQFLNLEEPEEEEEVAISMDEVLANRLDEDTDEVLDYLEFQEVVSVSSLRRRFGWGQPRAGRMIDILTEKQFISKPEGNKPRTVYVDRIKAYKENNNA